MALHPSFIPIPLRTDGPTVPPYLKQGFNVNVNLILFPNHILNAIGHVIGLEAGSFR
jgi:hypothetical protein